MVLNSRDNSLWLTIIGFLVVGYLAGTAHREEGRRALAELAEVEQALADEKATRVAAEHKLYEMKDEVNAKQKVMLQLYHAIAAATSEEDTVKPPPPSQVRHHPQPLARAEPLLRTTFPTDHRPPTSHFFAAAHCPKPLPALRQRCRSLFIKNHMMIPGLNP